MRRQKFQERPEQTGPSLYFDTIRHKSEKRAHHCFFASQTAGIQSIKERNQGAS